MCCTQHHARLPILRQKVVFPGESLSSIFIGEDTSCDEGESSFVSRPFIKQIVELKEEESAYLLEFLNKHVESSHDLQLRAMWEPNTVVVWHNRKRVHTAIMNWDTSVSRHAVRVSPQAEGPTDSLEDLNKPKPEFGDGQFSAHFTSSSV